MSRNVIPGTYSSTIEEILKRAVSDKYSDSEGTDDSTQKYLSLKLPVECKQLFLEVKARLSLDTGQNLSNVDICRILVEAAHKELVE